MVKLQIFKYSNCVDHLTPHPLIGGAFSLAGELILNDGDVADKVVAVDLAGEADAAGALRLA